MTDFEKMCEMELSNVWTKMQIIDAHDKDIKRVREETIKRVMEVRPDFNNQKEIDWKCPSCGRYGEEGEYCPSDRRKLVKEEREYPDEQDEAHNQALQEWTDNINKLK